jgi:hypothetical protein
LQLLPRRAQLIFPLLLTALGLQLLPLSDTGPEKITTEKTQQRHRIISSSFTAALSPSS